MKLGGKSENIIIPLIAVILAFLIGGAIIAALGSSPVDAVGYLVKGAFGSKTNVGATLVKVTPLIFTGLCACFAYRCGVFNLGGEGQFIMGAVAAAWVTVGCGLKARYPVWRLCSLACLRAAYGARYRVS